jgi:H+/Cl- antiporter ClcA
MNKFLANNLSTINSILAGSIVVASTIVFAAKMGSHGDMVALEQGELDPLALVIGIICGLIFGLIGAIVVCGIPAVIIDQRNATRELVELIKRQAGQE